jgi:DNA-directed RNA polymerase specialized sigma24 family protein
MHTDIDSSINAPVQTADEQIWHELYLWLLPLVERWVCCAEVASWRGQQKEISEDIAQEAVVRTYHYSQRASRGEVRAIECLKSLCRTIAQNHFRDRRKKDWCLLHPTQGELLPAMHILVNDQIDPSQVAIDRMMFITIIKTAAKAVAKFPLRQRTALLTDLANLTDFGEHPSQLELALFSEGIRLHDYRRSLPNESAERNKYAAFLMFRRLKIDLRVQ